MRNNTIRLSTLTLIVKQKGKAEVLDGRAKFMDLWTVKDGVWKMSRVLSYDHGPAVR